MGVRLSVVALRSLHDELTRVTPLGLFGLAELVEDGTAHLLCASNRGLTRHVLQANELPGALLADHVDLIDAPIGSPALSPLTDGAVAWLLRETSTRRLISVPLGPRVRLWLTPRGEEALSSAHVPALQSAAKSAISWLESTEPSDGSGRDASSPDVRARLERASTMVGALLRLPEPETVASIVASVAREALPHDGMRLRLFERDLTAFDVVVDGNGTVADDAARQPGVPPQVTRTWDVDLLWDQGAGELAAGTPPDLAGQSSVLRVAMRADGHVIGDLTFAATAPNQYTWNDIDVGRRLADQSALALAHHWATRDSSGHVSTADARAANIQVLDRLLFTLTGVLDVREVFHHVSAIAQTVLPHDAMSISELIDDGRRVRIHASHGLGSLDEPYDMVLPEPYMAKGTWGYRLLDDVREHPEYARGPGWAAGMRCMLFVEIRMEDRNYGGLNFYSRRVGHFVQDDVRVARRITDHVALALSHRRLAEEVRLNEELRARATSLELLDQLLATIAVTGDIGNVLNTTSGVIGRVLPHDGAVLVLRLADGAARVQAAIGIAAQLNASTAIPAGFVSPTGADCLIVVDLKNEASAFHERLSEMGCRSLIKVPIQKNGRSVGVLVLLSTATGAFKPGDAMVVRRLAERLEISLARDREIAASQRADEATARAARLEARVKSLTEELDARTGYRRVVGESPQWRQVLRQAAQVAATDTTVLLLGESGTGKEVVARFLHRGSPRHGGPFVALNCAALPEQLLEAELFGYERGAYTGATQSKPGQLEQASGGTLFLDEVAEMSTTAQPKFLRVLQEREFQRLGGTRVLKTDARIVAATNRDLMKSIANNQFREDLYYRLNVFAIRLPALRERRDDILPLSEAFIAEIGRGLGRPPAGISRDAREVLLDYHWPGNVRELHNVLERAAILCEGGLITAEYLALSAAPGVSSLATAAPTSRFETVHEWNGSVPGDVPLTRAPAGSGATEWKDAAGGGHDLNAMERSMIERALTAAKFNKSKAAKALGLTRHQLYIRMKRHNLE